MFCKTDDSKIIAFLVRITLRRQLSLPCSGLKCQGKLFYLRYASYSINFSLHFHSNIFQKCQNFRKKRLTDKIWSLAIHKRHICGQTLNLALNILRLFNNWKFTEHSIYSIQLNFEIKHWMRIFFEFWLKYHLTWFVAVGNYLLKYLF